MKVLVNLLFELENSNQVKKRIQGIKLSFVLRESNLKHESLILAQDERWRRA